MALHARRGAALIISLAFVVLLTVLVLAFFTQTRNYQHLANSSFNDFKSATLGQSALQVIVSDLQQELLDNSTATAHATGTLYAPKTAKDAIPRRYPVLTVSGTDPVPNLVRVSSGSDTAALHRAATVSSTTPALNGQYVSLARWNKHYLVPRSAAYDGNPRRPGTEPVAQFPAPDWIYVTGSGPAASPAADSRVIGRYAFAIFNEGGLLDANVAGFPASLTARNAASGTSAVWGYADKGGAAFADLRALGLADSEVDLLVGWRNFASAQAGGNFADGYRFADSGKRWHDFVQSNTTGFLTVSGSVHNDFTDQAFVSRQQLVKFFTSGSLPLSALQYLGTFSRDLDQPSFIPNPNRPKVQSNSSTLGPLGIGNDAYGLDRDSNPRTDINPPLPLVRVKNNFTRNDGTPAVTGEPLLKKRFPLSRLGLLTHTATASRSDSDPIYKYFGIYRASATQPWTYDHGDAAGILRLDQVADRNREPDFFELLKAAINVGSLAKSIAWNTNSITGWNVNGTYMQAHHQRDILTALQVLQIGANIIDQYDADSYPTRVAIGSGATQRVVAGIEDLPYIYSIRNRPSFPSMNVGRWLMQPVLWNPHQPSALALAAAPTEFRIRIEPADGAQKLEMTATYKIQQWWVDGVKFEDKNPLVLTFGADWDNAEPDGEPLTFSVGDSGTGAASFRQPTLLGEANVPNGTNAHGNNFRQQTVDTNVELVGLLLGEFLAWCPGRNPPNDNQLISKLNITNGVPQGVRFILEYADSGNWVPYNTFTYWWEGTGITIGFSNTRTETEFLAWLRDYLANQGGKKAIDITRCLGMTRNDPRTERWGEVHTEFSDLVPALEVANNIYETYRGGTGLGYSVHTGGPQDEGKGWFFKAVYNNTKQYRGYQFAYYGENSARPTRQEDGANDSRRFYRDPDGIVRRGMAGYATDADSGGGFDNLDGLPLANRNFASRPLILNRPFRSVAELGYVFRGTPWKNLDFSFPESGDAALLDMFCVNEQSNDSGLVAGRVDLNTRNAPVAAALIQGAALTNSGTQTVSAAQARAIADALAARNTVSPSAANFYPLANRADLIGRWIGSGATPAVPPNNTADSAVNPANYYSGFTADIGAADGVKGTALALIPQQREAAIRALADAGISRTWNLLIDVIAQSGQFPTGTTDLQKFAVAGEKRYWLHVAIDRLTGKILDYQLEAVSE